MIFQIDEPSVNKIMDYIQLGLKENAKLETGGKRIGKDGLFVEPTVFSNVTDDMSIAKDEVRLLEIIRDFKMLISYTVLD